MEMPPRPYLSVAVCSPEVSDGGCIPAEGAANGLESSQVVKGVCQENQANSSTIDSHYRKKQTPRFFGHARALSFKEGGAGRHLEPEGHEDKP